MSQSEQNKVFDEHLLRLRQKRAASRYARGFEKSPGFLLDYVADDFTARLATINRQFDCAVDLFGRTGVIAHALSLHPAISKVVRLESEGFYLVDPKTETIISDPATITLEESSVDLVVSAFALHWMDDLPGSMMQIRKALRPDGLFLALFPGPDTLKELRQSLVAAESELFGGATPRVDPFITVQSAGSLLQNTGFALPVVDSDQVVVRYDTAFDLMHDLRSMGATNVLRSREIGKFSKKLFRRAAEIYSECFSDDDGRLRATFEFISLSGWVPHESQQKPLKPGSAKFSLADVLNKSGG